MIRGKSWLAWILLCTGSACAGPQPPEDVLPETQARAAALAEVPGARVRSQELEREQGTWVYSYDLEVAGREGVEEILIDAVTGEVVAREHETPEQERLEKEREPPEEAGAAAAGSGTHPAAVATPYEPDVDPASFVDRVDNPYFPLTPGTVFRYANSNGRATNVVTVTDRTKEVMGIAATVVLDRGYADGELVEETYDWYAQDRRGNVWYLGEDSREMEKGRAVSTSGSWEAGRDGARPGIIMLAHPAPGERYRQEYREGEAEDIGTVLETGAEVTVPYGAFSDCVRTEDTTPLEPDVRETKVYCRGTGLVLENEGPDSRNRLVAVEPD